MDDDINYNISEDELRFQQKVNLVASINSMRMSLVLKSRMQISLCRIVYMPMVWPILDFDFKKLKQEFVHGYRDGSCVFYVFLTNETGKEYFATEEDKRTWGLLWNQQFEVFNTFVDYNPDLAYLKNCMFFVCNGNHRLLFLDGVHPTSTQL
jgi:hypothetical protein